MSISDLFLGLDTVTVGGLPIARLDIKQTAKLMVEAAIMNSPAEPPRYFTSANGEVIARCRNDVKLRQLVCRAEIISADGQSLVFASQLFTKRPLPERVATTDLFDVVAAEATRRGATFYLLGATEYANKGAYERTRYLFPNLKIIGRSHGYLDQERWPGKICEINQLGPDILWISQGVPLEQQFVARWANNLTNVGVIKTSGGLFDFLSGAKRRAPIWMQRAGLEWAYRVSLEPNRLFLRYAVTNPIAALELARSTH